MSNERDSGAGVRAGGEPAGGATDGGSAGVRAGGEPAGGATDGGSAGPAPEQPVPDGTRPLTVGDALAARQSSQANSPAERPASERRPSPSRPSPPPPRPASQAPPQAVAEPELLPERQRREPDPQAPYAPPPPVRRRRLSATARFYLGFWLAVIVAVAAIGGIGFKLGASRGAAEARASELRTLGIEAQCLRDAKMVTSNPPADAKTSGAPIPYLKAVNALVGANHCAQTSRLPYLSQSDLSELSGIKLEGTDLPPPSDDRWTHPLVTPPKAGGATGITVRSGGL